MPKKDYSKMFDTPEDHARERKALMSYHRHTVMLVTRGMEHGGQQVRTSMRLMKHKVFIVQGKHVK